MNSNVLVSVVVVTYNSSKYVIDTLESIYRQSYPNIELIICDDASVDNTVEICNDWLFRHKKRFTNTVLIRHRSNIGVTANCNSGYKVANGEWVKDIAGDDILLDDCIEKNLINVLRNHNSKFFFSNVEIFGDEKLCKEHNPYQLLQDQNKFFAATPYEQYMYLITKTIPFYGCTLFVNRKAIIDLGGFDEEIRNMEDYPMWIKATQNGFKLEYFDSITVRYRQHSGSTMGQRYSENSFWRRIKSSNVDKARYLVYLKYLYKPLLKCDFKGAILKRHILKVRYVDNVAYKVYLLVIYMFLKLVFVRKSPNIKYSNFKQC